MMELDDGIDGTFVSIRQYVGLSEALLKGEGNRELTSNQAIMLKETTGDLSKQVPNLVGPEHHHSSC